MTHSRIAQLVRTVRDLRLNVVTLSLAIAAAVATLPTGAPAETSLGALLQSLGGKSDPKGIASSNGRIEAQTIDVAAKYAGRLDEVLPKEGEVVEAGAVLARLDDRDMQAQILGAKAAVLRAKASKQIAEASVMQAQSALEVARTTHDRVVKLNADGHAAQSVLDDATNSLHSAEAAVAMAEAQVSDSDALISQSEAELDRLNVALDDLVVRAPLRARVLYRLHEPGEVVAAGTPILTLLDLTDVYMNLYLSAPVVGALALNDESRIILDPIPDYVIPARITFISPESQFTPKTVETQEEREQLVFRVKLSIPRDLLEKFESYVKVGIRGVGYVRTEPGMDWPQDLQVKLPQ